MQRHNKSIPDIAEFTDSLSSQLNIGNPAKIDTIHRFTPKFSAKTLGPYHGPQIETENTTFTIAPPCTGSSDAISRIALAHDIATSHLRNAQYASKKYNNPHCQELDYQELFGLNSTNGKDGRICEPGVDLLTIKLTELLDIIENPSRKSHGENKLFANQHITILPDLFDAQERTIQFARETGYNSNYKSQLTYSPRRNPFQARNKEYANIVIHLRRGDICYSTAISDINIRETPKDLEELKAKSKQLLELSTAIDAIKRLDNPQLHKANILICSDGFEAIKAKLEPYPRLLNNIAHAETRLKSEIYALGQRHAIECIIGCTSEDTIKTFDAMYHADIVVTASSCFPYIICGIGSTEIVNIELQAL